MVTKQSIESTKRLVLERQDFMCIQCKKSIDVRNAKSYAFLSSNGLNNRRKFIDAKSLFCLCLKCCRTKNGHITNEARRQRTQSIILSGHNNCNKCNEIKHIDMFSFSPNGNIKSICKSCTNKRRRSYITNEKNDEINKRRRERYAQRVSANDVEFLAAKRERYTKQNKKRSLTGKAAEYDKERRKRILQKKFMGKFCELHLLKCYVCNDCVTSKSDNQKKCNNCKSNKIRKKFKALNLQDFICSSCAIHYRSTKANKGICKKCFPKSRVSYKDHIERAKKKGVKYERFSSDLIYKRDGYKCTSCSCVVVKSKTYKPNQATIDHIIPMSKGGSHTIDNVVTMCQSCNSLKRDLIKNGTQIGIFCSVNQ